MANNADTRITIHDAGFIVAPAEGKTNRVPWADIEEIRAFRISLSFEGEIRIALKVEPDYWVDLSNKQPGFAEFAHQLQLRFPSVAGWEGVVQRSGMPRDGWVLYRRI
jgi:hypothetical protein